MPSRPDGVSCSVCPAFSSSSCFPRISLCTDMVTRDKSRQARARRPVRRYSLAEILPTVWSRAASMTLVNRILTSRGSNSLNELDGRVIRRIADVSGSKKDRIRDLLDLVESFPPEHRKIENEDLCGRLTMETATVGQLLGAFREGDAELAMEICKALMDEPVEIAELLADFFQGFLWFMALKRAGRTSEEIQRELGIRRELQVIWDRWPVDTIRLLQALPMILDLNDNLRSRRGTPPQLLAECAANLCEILNGSASLPKQVSGVPAVLLLVCRLLLICSSSPSVFRNLSSTI
uniref:Uncharacterized protein n=1 Tax=Compsopogon caeruleus TaxID=31354 RepID=A0A6T6C3J2_9RHOD|mmetsp:Transcript_3523/g.6641  ORF Transcript_3523/g.6641 Transcript_3523/m.6641 type:complete len:293 (+) Transcript_3523:1241-2119(+)